MIHRDLGLGAIHGSARLLHAAAHQSAVARKCIAEHGVGHGDGGGGVTQNVCPYTADVYLPLIAFCTAGCMQRGRASHGQGDALLGQGGVLGSGSGQVQGSDVTVGGGAGVGDIGSGENFLGGGNHFLLLGRNRLCILEPLGICIRVHGGCPCGNRRAGKHQQRQNQGSQSGAHIHGMPPRS